MMKKGTSRLANHLALAMFFAVSSASAEELVVPGSGNNEFVVRELAKAFNARQTQHRVTVPPSSGMAGAVRDVSEESHPWDASGARSAMSNWPRDWPISRWVAMRSP